MVSPDFPDFCPRISPDFQPRTKGITFGGIAAAISTYVSILTGVPQLVKENMDSIPLWLRNPNVLWAVGIAIVYGTIVLVVCLKDRKKKQPAWIQQAEDRMQPIMLYMQRLGEKYKKSGITVKTTLADMDENEAKILIDDFTKELPRFIGEPLV